MRAVRSMAGSALGRTFIQISRGRTGGERTRRRDREELKEKRLFGPSMEYCGWETANGKTLLDCGNMSSPQVDTTVSPRRSRLSNCSRCLLPPFSSASPFFSFTIIQACTPAMRCAPVVTPGRHWPLSLLQQPGTSAARTGISRTITSPHASNHVHSACCYIVIGKRRLSIRH